MSDGRGSSECNHHVFKHSAITEWECVAGSTFSIQKNKGKEGKKTNKNYMLLENKKTGRESAKMKGVNTNVDFKK